MCAKKTYPGPDVRDFKLTLHIEKKKLPKKCIRSKVQDGKVFKHTYSKGLFRLKYNFITFDCDTPMYYLANNSTLR